MPLIVGHVDDGNILAPLEDVEQRLLILEATCSHPNTHKTRILTSSSGQTVARIRNISQEKKIQRAMEKTHNIVTGLQVLGAPTGCR